MLAQLWGVVQPATRHTACVQAAPHGILSLHSDTHFELTAFGLRLWVPAFAYY
jgi:hypothetical protein